MVGIKVFIIGGSGAVGSFLIPMLVRAGYETYSVSLSDSLPCTSSPLWHRAMHIPLDRRTPELFAQLGRIKPDIIVDLCPQDAPGCAELTKYMRSAGTGHYIFLSSREVMGRVDVSPADPDKQDRKPLTERGKELLKCEQLLKDERQRSGLPYTIIIPAELTAPGRVPISPTGIRSLQQLQEIADGKETSLPFGGMGRLSLLHGEDAARAVFLAINNRSVSVGEVFGIGPEDSVSSYGYAEYLYEYFFHKPKIRLPEWGEWCSSIGDDKLCEKARTSLLSGGMISSEKAERLLGWRANYDSLSAADSAVQSLISSGDLKYSFFLK